MSVAFRNVDADPSDPVDTWPHEALATVLERGLVADWQPLFAEIRLRPWGPVARSIDRILERDPIPGVAPLFRRAIAEARRHEDDVDRAVVAGRVRAAVERSGLTARALADLVGTSASRLSTYASGKVTPSAAMLVRIERVASLSRVPSVTRGG